MKSACISSHGTFLAKITFLLLIAVSFSLYSCDLFLPSYSVTYDQNGASTGIVPVDPDSYKTGKIVTVMSAGTLTREGYTFGGWNTLASGSGTTYAPATTFTMGSADVILFAKWTLIPTYTVTYDGNGATSGSVPIDLSSYQATRTVTVKNSGTLVRDYFSFAGWNTLADGTGTSYSTGATFAMGTNNVTLYAKWTAVIVNLSLESGTTVDVSHFNGTNIYSIVTAMPGAAAQGNSSPTSTYTYTLSSTTGTAANVVPGGIKTRSLPSWTSSVYKPSQVKLDKRMREAEERALRSRARQISRTSPKTLRAAPASIAVGTAWNGVNIYDANDTLKTINTTCRYISGHAYFFVDNRNTDAVASYLAAYGSSFDSIYSINRSKFGNENDVDSNGKVIIVFSQELSDSVLGYFYSADKYSSTYYSDSNEGDIFYLTTESTHQGDTLKGALAHEFQHMIYFDQHYNLNATSTYAWLNEALSQAAEYYNGYLDNHLGWIKSFLNNDWPGLSLTYWTPSNYGYGAIFIRYLIEQYGDTAIKNMCSTEKIGIAAVEAATGAPFSTIFGNFIQAIVMSNTGDSGDSKYGFSTLNLRTVQPLYRQGLLHYPTLLSAGSNYSYTLHAYEFSFDKWQGTFGRLGVSGTSMSGTAFGLSY